MSTTLSRRVFPVVLALFVLALDFTSKMATALYIPKMSSFSLWYPYNGFGVFKDFLGIQFSIVHATNLGAAWNFLEQWPNFLIALRIVFVSALLVYMIFYCKKEQSLIPLTLIFAGALGNIIDALVHHHVIDMFYFVFWGYSYPVFNVADISICLGVFSLLIMSFFPSTEKVAIRQKR